MGEMVEMGSAGPGGVAKVGDLDAGDPPTLDPLLDGGAGVVGVDVHPVASVATGAGGVPLARATGPGASDGAALVFSSATVVANLSPHSPLPVVPTSPPP